MGAYKYYNPSTQQWEIIKSKSIIKPDGSLEYTPDDIKAIQTDVDAHKVDDVSQGEIHGLRVNNGKLEYYDEEWKIASGTPEAKTWNDLKGGNTWNDLRGM